MPPQSIAKLRSRGANEGSFLRVFRGILVSAVGLIDGWTARGSTDETGASEEPDDVEVFAFPPGFVARTKDANPEVLMLSIDSHQELLVGLRDVDALKSIEADLGEDADQAAVYTSLSWLYFNGEGGVFLGARGGTFSKVALEGHVHGPGTYANGGGNVTGDSGGAKANPLSGDGISESVKVSE